LANYLTNILKSNYSQQSKVENYAFNKEHTSNVVIINV